MSGAIITSESDLRRLIREEVAANVTGARLLRKKDAAAYLSISERSLDDLVRTGELKRVELCGAKFDVRELDRVIAARTG